MTHELLHGQSDVLRGGIASDEDGRLWVLHHLRLSFIQRTLHPCVLGFTGTLRQLGPAIGASRIQLTWSLTSTTWWLMLELVY